MRLLLALLLLLAAAAATADSGVRGIWYDRARDGHGLDIVEAGDIHFIVFYTYDAAGEPEWYAATGRLAGNRYDGTLVRYTAPPAPGQPAQGRTVGTLAIDFAIAPRTGACADGADRGSARVAALSVRIDAESFAWCIEPLVPLGRDPVGMMGGLWYGGPADDGWGIGTYFVARAGGAIDAVALHYYYDAAGAPRWVIANAPASGYTFDSSWQSMSGYCRSCTPRALTPRAAGSVRLALSTPIQDPGLQSNRLEQTLAHPGPNGGRFDRNTRLVRLSGTFAPARTAVTRDGIVVGNAADGGTEAYFAIPYAAPPTGALRWRAPQAAAPRYTALAATDFGPACPQLPGQGFFAAVPPRQSEDCLSLNVWTPAGAAGTQADRPVMVWIHGGGHVQGGAAQQYDGNRYIYDGSQFARRGAVVVSINYRLAALGYGVFAELIGEHPDQPGAGNYGLLDQIAALRWVEANIAAFGGNPGNVTIFGESAGGVSVCALLASPLARGLFDRAIIQSGNCTASVPQLTTPTANREAAVTQGERIKQRLGCTSGDVRTCLRAASVEAILAAGQGATSFAGTGETYGQVIDGHALTRNIGDALRDGSASPVPLIIGINEDETTTLIPVSQRPQTAEAYEALVRSRLSTIAPLVLQQYPAAAYTPVWRAWTAINTDIAFICPAARAARDHAAAGNPVYAYYFTQSLPTAPELGAFHAIEIPFLFTDMAEYPASFRELAARMKDTWVGFARTGIPATPGGAPWPIHPSTSQLGVVIDAMGMVPRAGYRDAYCGFWNRFVEL
jgi:para-nitrobenzyl esterase